MDFDNDSNNLFSGKSPEQALRRAHWLWLACLFLPFIYLGLAWWADRAWFSQRGGFGLWTIRRAAYPYLIAVLGVLALAAQIIQSRLRSHFDRRIAEQSLRPAQACPLVLRRTLYLVSCADVLCGLGLIVFLCIADWNILIACCAASYLLYAQAVPKKL